MPAIFENSLSTLLRRSARRVPEKTAVVYRHLRQSYRELDETTDRMAAALSRRGVRKGDRIAILSHNHHAFVVVQFALARLGAIMVPINFMLNAEEVAYILGHAGATGMIVEDALLPIAVKAIDVADMQDRIRVRGVIEERGGDVPAPWEPVQRWMSEPAEPLADAGLEDDDPLQLLYTSGTESRPKGAILTTRNLIAQYVSCIVDGEMSGDDVDIHALPLYHCAQLHVFLTPDIYLGATSIVLPGPEPAALLATIEAERATKLFCPPTVWISLLRHPDFDRRDLSSLKKGYFGASIMPMEIIRELSRRLPRVRLFNCYGQTEMSPIATMLKPADQLRKLGSAGLPCVNVETQVVDDDDLPVPPGTVGEIVHRGPHVMKGYWNDPEKTAAVFRNGWFHSGDLGVIDEEGYLSVVDRKKDMIKTGGENVASREVEEMIYQHADVAEVAVFGIPHPRWIEAVVAVAVPKPGSNLQAAALHEFCRSKLAGYKVPKYIVITDRLPKNASGKILKRELREQHSGLATTATDTTGL